MGDFEYGPQAPREYFENPGPCKKEYKQALEHFASYTKDKNDAADLLNSIIKGSCPFVEYIGDISMFGGNKKKWEDNE